MRAHRDGELHQNVHGSGPGRRRVVPEQRTEDRRTVGQGRGMLVHNFDLIAFEHCYIDELARLIAAVMFDDEKAGLGYLQHEA